MLEVAGREHRRNDLRISLFFLLLQQELGGQRLVEELHHLDDQVVVAAEPAGSSPGLFFD